MLTCPNCNRKNNDWARACVSCLAPLFPEKNSNILSNKNASILKCPICKTKNSSQSKNCRKCGHWLLDTYFPAQEVESETKSNTPIARLFLYFLLLVIIIFMISSVARNMGGTPWDYILVITALTFFMSALVMIYNIYKYSPWKKWMVTALVALLLFIIASSGSQKTDISKNKTLEIQSGFNIVETHAEVEQAQMYIVGILKNNTGKYCKNVQIDFNLYDKAGTLLGNTIATANNLDIGGTWKFKTAINEKDVATYKVMGISSH